MIMNNLYIIDFTSMHYIKIEEIKSRHNTCMIIKLEETHFTILLAFEKLIISFPVLSIFLEKQDIYFVIFTRLQFYKL